jgi:hypothetical protein
LIFYCSFGGGGDIDIIGSLWMDIDNEVIV